MQRISIQQVQAFEQFYRIPKALFISEKYNDMKLESKVAYAILRDRFELSVRNGWVDDDQNVYFVYTIAALGDLLSCGKNKVLGIKKDLGEHGLLEEVRQGLNKPNRLYLGLAIDENDEKNSPEPLVQAEVSKSN
ncbi:replication initiator protein A, partial [Fructobacillus tropaeoli]